MKIKGRFARELHGDAYRRLIRGIAQIADKIVLSVGTVPNEFVAALEPWCSTTTQRAEWPGYKLLDGEVVTVNEYEVSDGFLQLWESRITSLYGDDIAFVRSDGSEIFYVVAHERLAYISMTEEEGSRLSPAVTMDVERALGTFGHRSG